MVPSVIRAWGAGALVAAAAVLGAAAALADEARRPGAQDALGESPVPRPGLSPGEVIRIQLEALRRNDEHDRGIEVAFRFASPANRANTGPLDRFIRMIRQGPYALMLEYRKVSYGTVEVRGERARQRITLTGPRARVSYWFVLSRQSEAPCAGCWMTDAVFVERVEGRTA